MKFTLEYVKDYIASKNYTLLDETYTSSQIPLNILCPNGHKIRPTFSEFKRKERCNECSQNKKPSLEYISEFIKPKNFQLLSTSYKNNHSKLQVKCEKGHVWEITWNNLRLGNGCPHCYGNFKGTAKIDAPVQGITHSYTLEEVSSFFSNKRFKLLSTNYSNSKDKLDIVCDKGHNYSTTFAVSLKGYGCPVCSGCKKHTLEEISKYVESFGYTLKSDYYKNKNTTLLLKCPKGHDYETTFDYFKNGGSRCNSCSHQTSRAEQEVLDFVKQYYPNSKKVRFNDIVNDCPKEYKYKELDIFIPELNLAIEYCGLFWHSDISSKKSTSHHRNKLDWCNAHNIRLITIFEDEWLLRKDQVKNLLLSVMKISHIKIMARKCEVKNIDTSLAKQFICKYHIQPLQGACLVAFGLYYNNELIGVITGSSHHRQGQTGFVLQRLCFATGYQVSGGASKLLKHLINYAKSNNYDKLISWSDNRISEGNVYLKMGFSLSKEYQSDYSYVLNGKYDKRFSKQSLKKTKEERLTGKTEIQLREEQGYYRIWDCGKKLWMKML